MRDYGGGAGNRTHDRITRASLFWPKNMQIRAWDLDLALPQIPSVSAPVPWSYVTIYVTVRSLAAVGRGADPLAALTSECADVGWCALPRLGREQIKRSGDRAFGRSS